MIENLETGKVVFSYPINGNAVTKYDALHGKNIERIKEGKLLFDF